jgi:hypothetical protein
MEPRCATRFPKRGAKAGQSAPENRRFGFAIDPCGFKRGVAAAPAMTPAKQAPKQETNKFSGILRNF